MRILFFILLVFPALTQAQVTKKPVVYDVVHLKTGKIKKMATSPFAMNTTVCIRCLERCTTTLKRIKSTKNASKM
jgi:hypothetical protein